MSPGGYPIKGTQNWQSAFLPSVYQGTFVDTQHSSLDKLLEDTDISRMGLDEQRRQLDALQQLNRLHAEERAMPIYSPPEFSRTSKPFAACRRPPASSSTCREPAHVLEMYGSSVQAKTIPVLRGGWQNVASGSFSYGMGPASPGTTTTAIRN